MINKTSLSFSCSHELVKRIDKAVGESNRSALITQAIVLHLDRLEMEDVIRKRTEVWIKEKAVPAIRKALKGVDYNAIVELWSGTPTGRHYLISKSGVEMSDEVLKQALSEILRGME